MPITPFLDFWKRQPVENEDGARRLFSLHGQAVADLEAARARTLGFLRPVKSPKGSYVPGFADDCIDRVAALAVEIDGMEERLKSICYAIESFMEVAGPGVFVLQPAVTKRAECQGVIRRAAERAEAAAIHFRARHRGCSLEDMASDPDVAAAEENLARLKADMQPRIDELGQKMARLSEIVDQFGCGQ